MKQFMIIPLLLIGLLSKAQWSELGGANSLAPNSAISTLCTDTSGNIYAAGNFTQSIGYKYVAEFNGTAWIQLGSGYSNSLTATGTIESICVDKSGNVYAAGFFKNSSGYYYVAKWNGSTWTELGGANTLAANNEIFTLCTDTSGNVYTAGFFTNSSGNSYVAKWTKSSNTWSELGGNNSLAANSNISCVYADSLNNIYAAGNFNDGSTGQYVAEWNGTSWSELGTGSNALAPNNDILGLVTDGAGNLYATGGFRDGNNDNYVAKWNGSSWSELGGSGSLNAPFSNITSICKDKFGNIYVGGFFTNASSNRYVAEWNGTSWSELGGANSLAANNWIYSVITDPAGNVYTAGRFTNSNGNSYVAKYKNSSLPIRLTSFTATKQNNNVLLQWSTAQEENSGYFNIQRSPNGKDFLDIGKIRAAGNSNNARDYSYTDQTAGSLNSNILFYRLAETDLDGAITYSDIKEVQYETKNFKFSVFPNPAKDFVNITSSSDISNAVILITDMNGRTLYRTNKDFVAGNQLQISLAAFTKQVVIISVKANGTNQEFKVISQ